MLFEEHVETVRRALAARWCLRLDGDGNTRLEWRRQGLTLVQAQKAAAELVRRGEARFQHAKHGLAVVLAGKEFAR